MTFDLISGLHMQIQTWHPPLWLCTHAKYYVNSDLTNVLKNANKTKNMHLFSILIANYHRKTLSMAKVYIGYNLNAQTHTINGSQPIMCFLILDCNKYSQVGSLFSSFFLAI